MVPTLNVADVCPASTVTDAGTLTSTLLLLRLMTAPPAGAGPLKVTAPLKFVPPSTELAESVTLTNTAG
jgi:hypothetical protein